MPATEFRDRADDAVDALIIRDHLLVRLHVEGGQAHSHDAAGGSHAKISGSPTPFADRFTMLALDIEAGARRMHTELLMFVHGTRRTLPATSQAAQAVLVGSFGLPGIVVLLEAVQRADNGYASQLLEELESWPRRARIVLDEARVDEGREWTRLPVAKVARTSRYNRLGCHVCGAPLWLYRGFAHNPDAPAWCRTEACRNPSTGELRSYPQSVWRLLIETDDVLSPDQAAAVLSAA